MCHPDAQDPAKLTWAREVIGRQLRQLVRLVDDLLDVSRITRGKIELKLGPIVERLVSTAAPTTLATSSSTPLNMSSLSCCRRSRCW